MSSADKESAALREKNKGNEVSSDEIVTLVRLVSVLCV